MRQHPPRRWSDRLNSGLGSRPTPDAIRARSSLPIPAIPAHLRLETPGPDGVRRGLVAHVRELIAAGAYDAPDRWLAAEEAILDRYDE